MPFLRLTRDRRGYENTFLMHAAHPGESPRILYWYRSAPGVRVGRPALDEDAIRTIEEQHPDVDFDWPHILEVGAVIEPELERRPVRQKRRGGGREVPPDAKEPPTPMEAESESETEAAPVPVPAAQSPPSPPPEEELAQVVDTEDATGFESEEADAGMRPRSRAHDLLEELVGREIATRLHARYAEIIARVHRLPADHPERDAWQARAERLNPDNWVTADEVLRGVQHADMVFDSLRRELLGH